MTTVQHVNNGSFNTSGSTNNFMIDTSSNTTASWPTPTQTTGQSKCRDPTRNGGRCDLDGVYDDGKCHWHTEEQCYRITDGGTACELPGSRDDGACHHHTRGCNELHHTTIDKACFHGMKFSYRMLGLHADTERSGGPFSLQPQMAAEVAVRVGKTYLETIGEGYDREKSHDYFKENIVPKVSKDEGVLDAIKSKFNFGDDEELSLDILKKGIEQAWKQISNKEHHADGAKTAIVTAEFFLDTEVDVDA